MRKVWIIRWKDPYTDDVCIESIWDSEKAARKELERLRNQSDAVYYLDDFEVNS